VWGKRAVPGMTLIYARNEIQRLRVRVEDLERALRHADKEAKP
jgi:BMFP domain-containing protein YqiC